MRKFEYMSDDRLLEKIEELSTLEAVCGLHFFDHLKLDELWKEYNERNKAKGE